MKLSELIQNKEVTTPGGIKMTIKSGLSGKDSDNLALIEDKVEQKYTTVEKIIISWDLTDDMDVALPIDRENLEKLDLYDLLFILNFGK
jgi:hypothetical protein